MYFKKTKKHPLSFGFTLIEMMISVSVLAILSGVVISTINSQDQRDKAEDATRKSTLQKVAEAVETYRHIEGSYPSTPPSVVKQLKDSGYLQKSVEEDKLGYEIEIKSYGDNVVVIAPMASSDNDYFKYETDGGTIQECADTDIDKEGVCEPVDSNDSETPPDPEEPEEPTPPSPGCGDGTCAIGETVSTCPQDCEGPAQSGVCNYNGVCQRFRLENCNNCYHDCYRVCGGYQLF